MGERRQCGASALSLALEELFHHGGALVGVGGIVGRGEDHDVGPIAGRDLLLQHVIVGVMVGLDDLQLDAGQFFPLLFELLLAVGLSNTVPSMKIVIFSGFWTSAEAGMIMIDRIMATASTRVTSFFIDRFLPF